MFKNSTRKAFRFVTFLILTGALLAACSGPAATELPPTPTATPEPVTVKWTLPNFVNIPPDRTYVVAALNNMIHERLDPNITLDLEYKDSASYIQGLGMGFSAGEVCDIVYTPKWLNLFYGNVAQGNLLALDDYLTDVPELMAAVPAIEWPGVTVNGKIYGIPVIETDVADSGIALRTDLLEKYPLDWDTIHTYQDIEPWLKNVAANEPGIEFPLSAGDYWRPDAYGYDYLATGIESGVFTNGLIGVRYDDQSRTVVNLLKSEAFADYISWISKFYQDGLVTDFIETDTSTAALLKYVGMFHYVDPHALWGTDYSLFGKAIGTPFIGNFRIGENTNAICASSEHPLEALKVYSFINTDVEAFNTFMYGKEGTHWNWVDQSKKLIQIPDMATRWSTYWGPYQWQIGNSYISYYTNATWAEKDIWQMEKDANAAAVPSVMVGFAIDTTPILTEIASVSAVVTEFGPNLTRGWEQDPQAALANFIQLTDDAGMQTIVDEIQRQVNAWAASK